MLAHGSASGGGVCRYNWREHEPLVIPPSSVSAHPRAVRTRGRVRSPAGRATVRAPALRRDSGIREWHRLGTRQRHVAQPLAARNPRAGRRVSRLRQRRLARYLPRQQRRIGLLPAAEAAQERALQEQPRRDVLRGHRQGRGRGRPRVRDGLRHRRLRQRRLPRHPRHRLRPVHAVSQQRQRHVHRRDR